MSTTNPESRQKKALEEIKRLVQPQVVSYEGDDCTPPSYLDIYNLAVDGLRVSPKLREATCEPLLENSLSK